MDLRPVRAAIHACEPAVARGHHRDGNHDNNPPDGSNWELLCTYCHEAEHRKVLDNAGRGGDQAGGGKDSPATYRPFEKLGALLTRKSDESDKP